jgi:cell wall-associated NlpC family hydrolase
MNIPNLSNAKMFAVRQNLQTLGKQAGIKVPGIDVPVQVDTGIPDLVQQNAQSLLNAPDANAGTGVLSKNSGGASGVKPATGSALGYSNDIPIPPTSKIGAAVVKAALQMRGIPYSWGGGGAGGASKGIAQGANTVGFDCSGLTQYAFSKFGVNIPRVSYDQFRAGTPVPVNAMRPGDLVFFNTMRRAFSHVGIYVGEGKFIHSPKPGAEVRVEDMSGSYWRRRFDGARRVVEGDTTPVAETATERR